MGASTDERGEYFVVIDSPAGTGYSGCAVVHARSGGAAGRASAPAQFTSSAEGKTFARINVTLDPPAPLTHTAAERLVQALAAEINDVSGGISPDLALYVAQGPEALRVAREQYREALGDIVSIHPADDESSSSHRRVAFNLTGSTGRTARVVVHQEALTRMHSALLDYGFRSQMFMSAYVRSVASGDAVLLARVLSPDDIDYPVERARELIVGYRTRFRDTATIRPEFAGHDEKRAEIVWRLRGEGADGRERVEEIRLRYGDGLLSMVEPLR